MRTVILVNNEPFCLTTCPEVYKKWLIDNGPRFVTITSGYESLGARIKNKNYIVKFLPEKHPYWCRYYTRLKILDAISFIEYSKQATPEYYTPNQIFSLAAVADFLELISCKLISDSNVEAGLEENLFYITDNQLTWFLEPKRPYLGKRIHNENGDYEDITLHKWDGVCYSYGYGDTAIKDYNVIPSRD